MMLVLNMLIHRPCAVSDTENVITFQKNVSMETLKRQWEKRTMDDHITGKIGRIRKNIPVKRLFCNN